MTGITRLSRLPRQNAFETPAGDLPLIISQAASRAAESDQPSIIARYASMTPVITGTRREPRSNSADHCWHVCYQFCDLSAEITVYAENEAEARAKAVDQLRLRGLKVS